MLNFIQKGTANRDTIIFLHGFMGSANDWLDGVIPDLTDEFHCVAIDLPGHGKSVISDQSRYIVENCAGEVMQVMDSLRCSTTSLVGYSMGGRLALYLAVTYPERFDKVIIESSSPGLRSERQRRERTAHDERMAAKLDAVSLEQFVREWYEQPVFDYLDKISPRFEELVQRRLSNDPVGLSRSLRLMGTGVQPSLWESLDQITADLLLIVGEYDDKFVNIAHEMAGIRGNTTVLEMQGAGHNVHYDEPAEFSKQVRLFIKGLL